VFSVSFYDFRQYGRSFPPDWWFVYNKKKQNKKPKPEQTKKTPFTHCCELLALLVLVGEFLLLQMTGPCRIILEQLRELKMLAWVRTKGSDKQIQSLSVPRPSVHVRDIYSLHICIFICSRVSSPVALLLISCWLLMSYLCNGDFPMTKGVANCYQFLSPVVDSDSAKPVFCSGQKNILEWIWECWTNITAVLELLLPPALHQHLARIPKEWA